MKISKFSLAEMILIATVALGLFSLLVPMIYNSRQRSKTTQCVDNLRKTVGNGITNYTSQNDGYMPAWEYGWVKPVSTANGAVVDQVMLPKGEWACPSQAEEANDPTIPPATWWRGTHYGLNQHIASGRTDSDGNALPLWTRINVKDEVAPAWRRVKSPHAKVLAADAAGGNSLGVANADPVVSGSATKGRGASFALPPRPTPGLPSRRHADGVANFIFLDYHVESLTRFPEFMLGRGTSGYEFWHGEQWYAESGEQQPPKLVEALAPKEEPKPTPPPEP